MAKMITKKLHWLLVLSLVGSLMGWFLVEPVSSDTVDVWANIEEGLTCNYSVSGAETVQFGTLTTGGVTTATPVLQATSTTNLAFYHKLYDSGNGVDSPGLYSATGTVDIIGSANSSFADTAELAGATEGYGIQVATTSVGSGGTLIVATRYANHTGNWVGGLEYDSANEIAMASSSAAVTDRELNITMKAAISAGNAGGDYKDILTFICASSM